MVENAGAGGSRLQVAHHPGLDLDFLALQVGHQGHPVPWFSPEGVHHTAHGGPFDFGLSHMKQEVPRFDPLDQRLSLLPGHSDHLKTSVSFGAEGEPPRSISWESNSPFFPKNRAWLA